MSVLKANQKESRFEVTHHLYKVRREITDLLLRDFGFDLEKAEKKALKQVCGNKNPEELTDEEKYRYDKSIKKQLAFDEWFVKDERQEIMNCLRTIGNVYSAKVSYY